MNNIIEKFDKKFTWDKKGKTLMSSDADKIKSFLTTELSTLRESLLAEIEGKKITVARNSEQIKHNDALSEAQEIIKKLM